MEKFATLTKGSGVDRARRIAALVSTIQDCDNVTELSRLLTRAD